MVNTGTKETLFFQQKMFPYLWQCEGNAGVLPLCTCVKLAHIEQLEQIPPHLVDSWLDGLVQSQHLQPPREPGLSLLF